jgi:hypothetical protein
MEGIESDFLSGLVPLRDVHIHQNYIGYFCAWRRRAKDATAEREVPPLEGGILNVVGEALCATR